MTKHPAEKPRTKAEVEALLARKDEAIARRLDAIKGEVGAAGSAVKKVVGHPLLAVGATLAGGLVVGLMLGGKRKKKTKPPAQSTPIRDFYELVARDAEGLMEKGLAPEEAIREALRRRAPVVPDQRSEESPGLVRSLVTTAGRMFVTLALRNAMEAAVMKLMGQEEGAGEGTSGQQAS